MIFSTQKPAEIRILRTQDDLKKGTCKVRYAFRFAIQEATQTEITYDEQGNPIEQTIQGWQYEEVIDEMEIPLYLKPALSNILQTAYTQTVPVLEQNLSLANSEVPSEISLRE
jgi:hypothetical protein